MLAGASRAWGAAACRDAIPSSVQRGADGRHHGAAKRLLECLHQIVAILRRDVEAARLLGETLHIEDALRARPAEARKLIADDMNGQRSTIRFEKFTEIARRPAASFLAVGH